MTDIPNMELIQARAALWKSVLQADEQIDLWKRAQQRWRGRIKAISNEYQRRLATQLAAVPLPKRDQFRESCRRGGLASARKRWGTKE